MNKKLLVLLTGLMMVLGVVMTSSAANAATVTNKPVTTVRGEVADNSKFDYDPSSELPSVTMQDANDYVEAKGQDSVSFLQVGGQWLAIAFFILSGFLALFGVFGKGPGKGIIGMGVSALVYAGITFAPYILQWFTAWTGTVK